MPFVAPDLDEPANRDCSFLFEIIVIMALISLSPLSTVGRREGLKEKMDRRLFNDSQCEATPIEMSIADELF